MRYQEFVWLFRLPGVYRPQGDTRMLMEALRSVRVGARVLDVGTGTGVLALTAARSGAAEVTAVDRCPYAVLTARVNARLRRLPVQVVRGDLLDDVRGETFDVIVANVPYVCSDGAPRGRRAAHTWDGGAGGRDLLDRLCALAPALLAPGGVLLMVQSALCGTDKTVEDLRTAGLWVAVSARRRQPFGPVMTARAAALEDHGVICPKQRYEELVVIRAEHRR
jgi:release factor glutamine methyltransferase